MKSLQHFVFRALLQLRTLYKRVSQYLFVSKVSTYLEWSDVSIMAPYHSLWSSYNRFFHRHGYTLWRRYGVPSVLQLPPNDNPRCPDGFSYHAYGTDENKFYYSNPKMHAARTKDNRDVLVVLLSDGVTGVNAVEVLRVVGTGVVAAIDRNHTLPVLQFLRHDNFTFGIFPLVGSQSIVPWFNYMEDALEFMSQIMEGVAFLHDRRIVHRDLFVSNFLTSRRNGKANPDIVGVAKEFVRPRYYIIDFEWAIQFPLNSHPTECTVIGPPCPLSLYNRPAAPEMRFSEPYCPFKSDVWQLGSTFLQCFRHLEGIPGVTSLLELMRADQPDTRPTARNAVERLNILRSELPSSVLHQLIEEGFVDEGDDM